MGSLLEGPRAAGQLPDFDLLRCGKASVAIGFKFQFKHRDAACQDSDSESEAPPDEVGSRPSNLLTGKPMIHES